MKLRASLVSLGLAAFVCGCGRPGNVAGTVTYKGKAIAHGALVIQASDSLPYSAPIVAGEYHIENVPPGPAKFAVVSRQSQRAFVRGQPKDTGKPAPPDPKWFPIPEKYADPMTSKLERVVIAGENKFNIVLTDTPAKK